MGQLFGAVAYVAEEKWLGEFDNLDPMLLVVYEGVAGIMIWAFLLPIFQFIPCDNKALCSGGVIEDTAGAFRSYAANPTLILYSVSLIISVTFLASAGIQVVKYGSAAQRTTSDMLRPMFVWIFFMILPVEQKDGSMRPSEVFSWLQLGGYVILVTGVLVYNEIIVVPFFNYDKFTKIAIEKREKAENNKLASNESIDI